MVEPARSNGKKTLRFPAASRGSKMRSFLRSLLVTKLMVQPSRTSGQDHYPMLPHSDCISKMSGAAVLVIAFPHEVFSFSPPAKNQGDYDGEPQNVANGEDELVPTAFRLDGHDEFLRLHYPSILAGGAESHTAICLVVLN